MTAIIRSLALVVCLLMVVSIGAPVISGQQNMTQTPSEAQSETPTPMSTPTPTDTPSEAPSTPSQDTPTQTEPPDDAIEDGVIKKCTTIGESGQYELESDLDGEPDGDACLVIQAASVTIDGNGHELRGNEADANGIRVAASYDSGEVVIEDIRVIRWGDNGVYHTSGPLTIQNSDLMWNGRGYNANQAGDVTLTNLNVKMNTGSGMTLSRMGDVDLDRVESVGNDGSGFHVMDGADVEIDQSIFNSNGVYGLYLGHSISADVHSIDAKVNDEAGILIGSGLSSPDVEVTGSAITGNNGPGIAAPYGGDEVPTELGNVDLSRNDEGALDFYDEGDDEARSTVEATNVMVGSISLDFDAQSLDVETEESDEMDTDELVLRGDDSLTVTARFTVSGDEGRLWYRAIDGWERYGTYDMGMSSTFEEDISDGRWGATGVEQQQTSTPAPTDTPTDQPTDEPTDTPTDEPTDEPTRTSTPQQNDPSGPTPTPEPQESPTPTDDVTNTPDQGTDTQSTPTDAISTPDNETSEPEDGDREETQADTETNAGDDTVGPETESDNGLAMDGPGFGPLSALIAILGSSLLLRRRL